MSRIRTAIVGCGKVAHLHAAALQDLPAVQLVGVCDVDPARAQEFGKHYGVSAYNGVESLLKNAKAEAVIICTPHPQHATPAIFAAEAGVHVLVEKPLAASLRDCDAMIEAAIRHGVRLGVVSQRRFMPPVARMKAAITAGKIGSPVLGTVAMFSWRDAGYYQSDAWRGRWATEGGGVLMNQSPHHLDILLWLMGPASEVTGYWANLNHPYIEVEDTVACSVRFRNGGIGSLIVSVGQKPGLYTKIHVHGSTGASVGAQTDTGATFIAGVTGPAARPEQDIWTIPGEEHLLDGFQQADRSHSGDYHRLQDGEFFAAVGEKRGPLVSGEDGRRVVELITAAYRSSSEGRSVQLTNC